MYSKSKRKKGRKSVLYTQFRCTSEPWQSSPPQTPDDENNAENVAPKRFATKRRNIAYQNNNDNRSEYAINSNLSIGSGLTQPCSQTVAPAPTIKSNHSNNNRYRRPLRSRTINDVKKNISKYVKMENANVLQSHQYTKKQTKLNIKTAPVPIPFIKSHHDKKSIKSKQKQKQTSSHNIKKKSV